MKNLLMISSNGQYSNHPKQFTCITVHQTSVLREPWRWHFHSTSKMMVFHYFRLLPIPINKQDMSGLQITQRSILWSIFIFPPTGNQYKVSHSNTKLSRIPKSTLSSPLPKVKLFIPLQNQNHMSNSLPPWILTMEMTLLLLLSLPLIMNLEDLDQNIKTLLSTFAL